jgi:hypothetical protein
MFLQSISNFRALSILLIVMGHMYFYGFMSESSISQFIKNLITGGTIFFVFISGYMFHHVFIRKFNYVRFVFKKICNIFLPYLFLGFIAIFLLYITNSGYFDSHNSTYGEGILFMPEDSKVLIFFKYIISGRFLIAYWYIPFVMLVFLFSPIFIGYSKLGVKWMMFIFLFFSLISIFIHRPILQLNPIQSFFYFSPFYLLGIMISQYRVSASVFFDKYFYLGVLLSITFSLIAVCYDHNGTSMKQALSYQGIDYMFLQKLFLCMVLYHFFDKNDFQSSFFDTLSEYSFAIFFIHPWYMALGYKFSVKFFGGEFNDSVIFYFISVLVIIYISIFSAYLIKKIFKGSQHTRKLIGF